MPSTLLDLQEVTHGPTTSAFARSVLLLTVLPLLLLGHVASAGVIPHDIRSTQSFTGIGL